MEAVILAAGLGTRLRPHTLTTPKPLLPVQGRPILDWILGALPPEVKRVLVVVNYLADQIEQYLHQQPWFADWQTVRQETPRGTGDAFRSCRSHLHSDRYLVLNGDDLYGAADLAALVGKEAGLLVHPVDDPKKFGIAFARPDGTLERLVEKPNLEGRQMANVGAYVFPRRVFDIKLNPSQRGEYEITDYVSGLAAEGVVHAVPAKFWLPIGDVEAWRAAEGVDLGACRSGRRIAVD
jgi:bifunctional UDP-N-acetylglucosamine pyrophosphorylase/glucosamine-1-phosphate N-acetyltransferase